MNPPTTSQIRAARAALSLLDFARNAVLHELLTRRGPVGTLAWLTDAERTPHEQAQHLGGISAEQFQARVAQLHSAARSAGASVLIPEDERWPALLDDAAHVGFSAVRGAALCLWTRGRSDTSLQKMVAVTGARAASAYGVYVAGTFGHGLAEAGWTVTATSGYGIDAAALRGALAAHGRPVAILPAGIDNLSPAGNSALLEQVAEHGLLITACPPGTRPSRERFAATASLLAAITTGTVVVEASLHSRALTTLGEALQRHRSAMVVPGPITSALSAGVHQALRNHRAVRPVRRVADVLADLAATP
jgi:DNA processing protein